MRKRIVRNKNTKNVEETPLIKTIDEIHQDELIKSAIAVVETEDNRIYVVTEGKAIELVGLLEFGKSGLLNTDWEEEE